MNKEELDKAELLLEEGDIKVFLIEKLLIFHRCSYYNEVHLGDSYHVFDLKTRKWEDNE